MFNFERLFAAKIPQRILATARAVTIGTDYPVGPSDYISLAGLALIYPEIVIERWTAHTAMLFIALGTTVDDLADEGAEIDSKGTGCSNAARYEMLAAVLSKRLASISDEDWENAVREQFADVWITERYAHAQQFSVNEQLQYRELINAVWTVMYADFAVRLLSSEISQIQRSPADEDVFELPELSFFNDQQEVVGNEYYELLRKYAYVINGEQGVDALIHILFLLVMETSNWYDTFLNKKSNRDETPRIRRYDPKYREALAIRGIPTWTTNTLFLSMSGFILTLRLLKTIHRKYKPMIESLRTWLGSFSFR